MLFRTQRKTLEPKPEGLPIRNGASPVASALSNRPRRDPGAAVRTYHGVPSRPLETGTFYLAGNRNFLFGSDTSAAATRCHVRRCQFIVYWDRPLANEGAMVQQPPGHQASSLEFELKIT
jgi:hypothetical protein